MKDAGIPYEHMKRTDAPVIVDLRIPGGWSSPQDLIKRLPNNCRVTPKMLILPDGLQLDLGFFPPDDQFPGIFRTSCRQPATEKELATVDRYAVNLTLSGRGGSIEAARRIMKAAAIIVRAGGAGVFIDNSLLAHGGRLWLEMTEDGGVDALSFAFAGIVHSEPDLYTLGMHVLGLRDIVLRRADLGTDFDIVDLILYMVRGEKIVEDGHIVAGVDGTWFSCRAEGGDPKMAGLPMHNPFGRLRLLRLRQIPSKGQEPAWARN